MKPMHHAVRFSLVGFLALVTLVPGRAGNQPPGFDAGEQVRAFVRASNERDLEGLLALAHEDVEWLSVEGNEVTVITSGRLALAESMEGYFESCPTCSSTLEWVTPAGSRVTAFERASWEGASGRQSQVSLAVYEFEDEAIRRVYYYPAEKVKPDGDAEEEGR